MVAENYLCPANHDFKQTAHNHVLDQLGQFNEKKKREYRVLLPMKNYAFDIAGVSLKIL